MILIDVEASGLHDTSFPTEVAWCNSDLREGASYLIRPTTEWLATPWSEEAEAITGISLDLLTAYGLDPIDVADHLNREIGGTSPLTDNPWLDGRWLRMIHHAAGGLPTYGTCPPPPREAGWGPLMAWSSAKAKYDLDAAVTRMLTEARLSPSKVNAETTRLRAATGLVEHRALDDAVGHALALGVVAAMADADQSNCNAVFDELVQRARALLARLGRGTRPES